MVIVTGVSKTFVHEGQRLEVLKAIDLEIGEGEMATIVGPSGAGKSTLLHLIGTLDLPSTGKILYDGVDVTGLNSSQLAEFRNRSIGFVFQFHHLLPEFTALENVMMPGMIHDGRRMRERAESLLEEVGLSHRLSHRPGELSGGEQQRVALARALLMEPRLVLADEPTGNLDSQTSESIQELFFDLNQRRGTTFLIVTHSRDFARGMPRVVAMKDGRIVGDERRAASQDDPAQAPENAGGPS